MRLSKKEREEIQKVIADLESARVKGKYYKELLKEKCKECHNKSFQECLSCEVYKFLNQIAELLGG